MAIVNKAITVLGASATVSGLHFMRETVAGVPRIRASIDGTSVDNLGAVVELKSANVLLPVGSPIETQVLALMNGLALVQIRTANGLET